jgi:dihydrofolate synthase / folylpolyglutamate synthase
VKSDAILERLLKLHPKTIDLVLDRVLVLLDDLGRPHDKLPPVVHIAGTNGKGSTLAFLRAILEAAGYSVHAYTSPHLVNFNERIRLASKLIDEKALADILDHCEQVNDGRPITYFEITTAAAFYAFANAPADILLLECGLGGQFDATTVIDRPLATAITPVSMDHMQFLGDTLAKIAFEKAAIQKPGVPSIVGPQSADAAEVISDYAKRVGAPLQRHGVEWRAEARMTNGQEGVAYCSPARNLEAPSLALPGEFQIENAGTAIAIVDNLNGFTISDEAIRVGLSTAEWPARLQRLEQGRLASILPPGWELWLDGGHNEAAATALASVAMNWDDRPLHLVFGMLNSKEPDAFLRPLASLVTSVHAVMIPSEENALPASDLAQVARQLEIKTHTADSVSVALQSLATETFATGRVLICGSLYLAGIVLAENG